MNGLVSGLNRLAKVERDCLDTGDAKDVNKKVSKANSYITKVNQKLGSGNQVRTIGSMTWGSHVAGKTTVCTTVTASQPSSASSSASSSTKTKTKATSSTESSASTISTSAPATSTSKEAKSECATMSVATCPYTAAQDMKAVADAASAFQGSMSAIIAMVPSGNPSGEQASLAFVQATAVPLAASQALLRYTSLNADDLSSALSAVESFVSTYLTLIQHFGSSVAYWVGIVTNTTSKPFVFWSWLDYYAGWMNCLVAMAVRLVNMERVCLDRSVLSSLNSKITSVNSVLAAINVSLDSDKAARTVNALVHNETGFQIVTCSAV